MLTLTPNLLLQPARLTVAGVEQELTRLPHLTADQRHETKKVRRDFRDGRKLLDAAEALGRIPDADEAFHLAISGRFSLWHLVPAVLKVSGSTIAELTVATLGFSRRNIAALCELLDAGKVGSARLLASHYFKGTSKEIYGYAVEEIDKRPGRASFLSVRTHAKLLMMKLADGRTVTVESSANLRSCKNIEQMTVVGDPGLYAFHRGWIDELFERGES